MFLFTKIQKDIFQVYLVISDEHRKKLLQISVQALLNLMISVTTLNTKKMFPCLVFPFGSDQPSRILRKMDQSDNVPITQRAGRSHEKKVIILLLSWGKKKKPGEKKPTT